MDTFASPLWYDRTEQPRLERRYWYKTSTLQQQQRQPTTTDKVGEVHPIISTTSGAMDNTGNMPPSCSTHASSSHANTPAQTQTLQPPLAGVLMVCEYCGQSTAEELDMIMHVHIAHEAEFSVACPCFLCGAARADGGLRVALGQAQVHAQAQTQVQAQGDPEMPEGGPVAAPALESGVELAQVAGGLEQPVSSPTAAADLVPALAPPPIVPPPQVLAHIHATPLIRPPDHSFFTTPNATLRENSLPYCMSLIEPGSYYLNSFGEASWHTNNTIAPILNPTGTQVIYNTRKHRPMRLLPFMPDRIPMPTPGWALYTYVRTGTTQTPPVEVRYVDLYDRMEQEMTHSALSNRISKWLARVGGLPMTSCFNFEWPSRHSIESISKLTADQARFNTWWDVQYLPSQDVYIVRQPDIHPGYQRRWTTPNEEAPYYFIEDHADRRTSGKVQEIADAILFLEIKAEESDIPLGTHGLMSWLTEKGQVADEWKQKLDLDILLEFQRWRKGCPDTPSIKDLRSALENAGSEDEVEAILAGDYSATPVLQLIETGLGGARAQRKADDEATKARVEEKSGLRRKRKAGKAAAAAGE